MYSIIFLFLVLSVCACHSQDVQLYSSYTLRTRPSWAPLS